jgi:cardiolipin synthase
MSALWATLTFIGYGLSLLLVPFVFLNKKKSSVSTVAWILTIILLPYFGGLLYLVFGINRVERRAALKKASNLLIGRHMPELSQYQMIPGEAKTLQNEHLTRVIDRIVATRPTFGNQIELIADTRHAQGLIEEAVLNARDSIHLEYYIWRPDQTGTRLRDMLIEKAKAGVHVRFLFDGLGSMTLGRAFFRPMREAGIRIATFLPGQSWRERWSINLRSHRKIVVVDGQVGFTGGMNIGDEYLGKNPILGYWRDTHIRLRGPTVLQLQQVFAEDWFFATGEEVVAPELFPIPDVSGDQVAEVVAGGPDGEVDVFHSLFFAAINEARHSITLATSYFVPTPSLVTALETAALRGVRVRLLLCQKSAHRWMVAAGRSYYESLLRSGVEIYEYTRGLLHSKTLTIDGKWSLVGSPNLDSRSLLLNFEVAVAMYDPRPAAQLEEHFATDSQYAERVRLEDFLKRPLTQIVIENACKLFSPVL